MVAEGEKRCGKRSQGGETTPPFECAYDCHQFTPQSACKVKYFTLRYVITLVPNHLPDENEYSLVRRCRSVAHFLEFIGSCKRDRHNGYHP